MLSFAGGAWEKAGLSVFSHLKENSNNILGLQMALSVLWDHCFAPMFAVLICSVFMLYFSRLRTSTKEKKGSKTNANTMKLWHILSGLVDQQNQGLKGTKSGATLPPWRQQHEVHSINDQGAPVRPSSPATPPGLEAPASSVDLPHGLQLPPCRKVMTPSRSPEQSERSPKDSDSPKSAPHPWRKRSSTSTDISEASPPQNSPSNCLSTSKFSMNGSVSNEEASAASRALAAAIRAEDWELALKNLVTAKVKGLQVAAVSQDRVWSLVLSGCSRLGIVGLAEQILDPVLSALPAIGYNILMKEYVKNSSPQKCIDLYSKMLANGVEPSAFTCGIVLNAHVGNRDVDKAVSFLRNMERAASDSDKPNLVHYTTILKGLIQAHRIQDAVEFFQEIPKPDVVTFSTLIKAHCDAGMVNEAVELLKSMENAGVMPDDIVFNTLLSHCSRNKNLILGRKLFNQMMNLGVIPSSTTLAHLFRLYCNTFRPNLAAELLQKVAQHKGEEEKEAPPKAYLDLLRSCIQLGRSEEAWRMYDVMSQYASIDDAKTRQFIQKLFQDGKDTKLIERVLTHMKLRSEPVSCSKPGARDTE